jgi:hypothetical protein
MTVTFLPARVEDRRTAAPADDAPRKQWSSRRGEALAEDSAQFDPFQKKCGTAAGRSKIIVCQVAPVTALQTTFASVKKPLMSNPFSFIP